MDFTTDVSIVYKRPYCRCGQRGLAKVILNAFRLPPRITVTLTTSPPLYFRRARSKSSSPPILADPNCTMRSHP
ncbi:MAG: hypothetical protein CM1200mP2_11030 [Planctomycetaceae bacterium]|nr:MAG: hypothetical protein CM1200mP2_11030 [Planctomycetaceae bacterium]